MLARAIKAALIGSGILLLVLAVVIGIRTAGLRSVQRPAEPEPALVHLDAARAVANLQRAVRIKTLSHQDPNRMEPEAFETFHGLLAEVFPKVHGDLKRETVARHSLLYTWAGSDANLKPLLLLAHMDVVPIGSPSAWTHPPFGGDVADGFIWGRGTIDDKGSLLGLLEAVEALLAEGYRPKRTIHLAFGHDEEVGGLGARAIADLLKQRDIRAELCLDEGLAIVEGMVPGMTAPVGLIGVAEKGYLTLELTARGPGGHSSQPPEESTLGVLSRAVTRLEDNPMPGGLRGIVSEMFDVLAPEMGLPLRAVFANLWLFQPLVESQLEAGRATAACLRTTTAVTIMQGGTKENILPTTASAIVNFRLLPGDTLGSVTEHVRRVVADDRIEIATPEPGHEASPVADRSGWGYQQVNRAIRQVFPNTVVAPGLVLGATDSRHYVDVADSQLRFTPLRFVEDDLQRIHGPNERVGVDAYIQSIRFFATLLRQASQE